MDIDPKEVEYIKVIGKLFDDDVKLIKTVGGFHVCVGKKNKNSRKPEPLAAGSHQAIVAHQVSREYGSDFQPSIFKSEHEALERVEKKTEYLPSDIIANGVDLYTLTKNDSFKFVLDRYGVALAEYQAEASNGSLIVKSVNFKHGIKADKRVAEAISRAMTDKMHEKSLKKVENKIER